MRYSYLSPILCLFIVLVILVYYCVLRYAFYTLLYIGVSITFGHNIMRKVSPALYLFWLDIIRNPILHRRRILVVLCCRYIRTLRVHNRFVL